MDLARGLASLSEQDLGIVRADKRLDEIPEKHAVLELRKRIRDFEVVRSKAQAYVDEAQRLLGRDEDEIAGLDAKIDIEQRKIISGEITNPKEIQALSRELDALKRRKDKLENVTIDVMEKLETGVAQVAKIDAVIATAHEKEAALIAAFQEKGGALQHEIAAMKAKRTALAAALPPDVMERYEHARETKHGIAVGVLRGDMCSACRIQLPAERIQALEAGPDIGECPSCKRLLIVRMVEVSE
ncbi:MAG: C4-type zinc ribbon domain-containing protein [Coriobacteriia bacterium]|nr:C4-type zinc ribbon domain-containing protein [Coriobacteriia bacterium]